MFPNLRIVTCVADFVLILACAHSEKYHVADATAIPFVIVNGRGISTDAKVNPVTPAPTELEYVTLEFHHSSTVPSHHFL